MTLTDIIRWELRVGFTGTQEGMTREQRAVVFSTMMLLASELRALAFNHDRVLPSIILHHGDCVGSDKQAHGIGRELGWWIVGHPPTNPKKRAYTQNDEEREPKDYIPRDHDIVDESHALIGAPRTVNEVIRSGTWTTIRHAQHTGKPVLIVNPPMEKLNLWRFESLYFWRQATYKVTEHYENHWSNGCIACRGSRM